MANPVVDVRCSPLFRHAFEHGLQVAFDVVLGHPKGSMAHRQGDGGFDPLIRFAPAFAQRRTTLHRCGTEFDQQLAAIVDVRL